MTDLDDEVRGIFAAPPDYTPRALDFDQIMVAGTRLRRRRQVLTGAAAVAAAFVLVVGGVQVAGHLGGPGPNQPAPVATVPTPPSVAPTKAPQISPNDNSLVGPLGALIDTGVVTKDKNKIVIYGTRQPTDPATSYGFSVGQQLPGGDVEEWWSVYQDPSIATGQAGFHATQYSASDVDGNEVPTFGYYVGKPAKITATYQGREVTAHLVGWDYRPNVTVFWFKLADVPAGGRIGRPHAFAADGAEMPVGVNTVHTPA